MECNLCFINQKTEILFKRDIEFISNENQNNSEQLLSNIYTMHVPVDNKSQQLVPVINFDINFNKPLIEILEQDYSGYVQKSEISNLI